MTLMAGLGYGYFLDPFERRMIWSTLSAGDRGVIRNYPIGVLLVAFSATSLWFGILAMIVIAVMDDDWPLSTLILFGICALLNIGLAIFLYSGPHLTWQTTFAFGGNLVLFSAVMGWWIGCMGNSQLIE
jgi:hypothetical protein